MHIKITAQYVSDRGFAMRELRFGRIFEEGFVCCALVRDSCRMS